MTITVDLAPELEQQIRAAAARTGMSPDRYIAEALRQKLKGASGQLEEPKASVQETELLLTINQSLSAIAWSRYHELIAKRQTAMLSPIEQQELIALSDAIEQANVSRIAAVAKLAQLRNTTFEETLNALGLINSDYA